MKTLSEILNGIADVTIIGNKDCTIKGIAFDSRKVSEGFLFAAIPGTAVDGHRFISTAITNGAKAVLCEQIPEHPDAKVTWIKAQNSSVTLGQIASNFCGNPSDSMNIVGITGTNGKSSTTALAIYAAQDLPQFGLGILGALVPDFDNQSYLINPDHKTEIK